MGIKVDCIPGRVTHTIFSSFFMGVFYGQCSELCGPLHGFMPICVEIIDFYNFFV
jgi:cytochrome c oxidase subunit 2